MIRQGFSLLEIIIATAVLAASAMVLTSLIGLGTKYGNRAEERTMATIQAESLLDEFLARLGSRSSQAEMTGELPGTPPHRFSISAVPFEFGEAAMRGGGEQFQQNKVGLLQVSVQIFEANSSQSNIATQSDAKPLITLSRLVRQPTATAEQSLQGSMP